MSLMTIAARLADEPLKLDDPDKVRILTALKMIYDGGSADGKTENFPTRDLCRVVIGVHRGHWHFFETYKRTIWINPRNRRTIFRYAGVTSKLTNSSWWKRLLAAVHIRKLKAIEI
jgi:hypothetical protein